MCEEMIKFRKLLDDNGISYVDDSDPENDYHRIDRTKFFYGNVMWSVINGFGTYGGHGIMGEVNEGLLEIYNGHDVLGFLDAEMAFNYITGGELK